MWPGFDNHVEGMLDLLPGGEESGELAGDDWGAMATTLFFIGGFVFDALTIGRYVNLYTLGYVGLYAVGVALCMVVRSRGWFESWRGSIDNALHFCLGAVFSALVCLYFRSAGHLWGFGTVALLAGLMLYNEYAVHAEPKRSIVWGIYAVSLVMYFNFLAPYLFRSLSEAWFYESIVVTMAALYALRHLAAIPTKSLVASGVFSVLLMGLYLFGAIPPVPLVMKQQIAGVDARKTGGRYVCEVGERSWWADLGLLDPTIQYASGERVGVLSAVAAPRGVSTPVAHRWQHWEDGEWETYSTIDLRMTGGRENGWRFFSYKEHLLPGLWRVETVVRGDWLLSTTSFRVEEIESIEGLERHSRALD
jgi:hypothetical protein